VIFFFSSTSEKKKTFKVIFFPLFALRSSLEGDDEEENKKLSSPLSLSLPASTSLFIDLLLFPEVARDSISPKWPWQAARPRSWSG